MYFNNCARTGVISSIFNINMHICIDINQDWKCEKETDKYITFNFLLSCSIEIITFLSQFINQNFEQKKQHSKSYMINKYTKYFQDF